MKPVIGLLLIAGGITLMYGLFMGKIHFSPLPDSASLTQQQAKQATQNVVPVVATANALPIGGLPKVSVPQGQAAAATAATLPIGGLNIFSWL